MMAKRLWVAFIMASVLGIIVVNANIKPVNADPGFTVYIDPDVSIWAPGTMFNVSIMIAGVPELFGWEFNVTWNPSLITLWLAVNSSFLWPLSPDKSSFFISDWTGYTKGWMYFSETALGSEEQTAGIGELAILGFTVKAGASGQCAIHLKPEETLLLELSEAVPPEITVIPQSQYEQKDGIFKYPYSSPFPGDVNKDGKIDIMDLAMIGVKYGMTGTPGWIPEDVVQNGVIDIVDLATCARYYGKYV